MTLQLSQNKKLFTIKEICQICCLIYLRQCHQKNLRWGGRGMIQILALPITTHLIQNFSAPPAPHLLKEILALDHLQIFSSFIRALYMGEWRVYKDSPKRPEVPGALWNLHHFPSESINALETKEGHFHWPSPRFGLGTMVGMPLPHKCQGLYNFAASVGVDNYKAWIKNLMYYLPVEW